VIENAFAELSGRHGEGKTFASTVGDSLPRIDARDSGSRQAQL